MTCIVQLADVLAPDQASFLWPGQKRYIEGPWCWLLSDVIPVHLLQCPGKLGLWTIEDSLLIPLHHDQAQKQIDTAPQPRGEAALGRMLGSELTPNVGNFRTHPKEQSSARAESLRKSVRPVNSWPIILSATAASLCLLTGIFERKTLPSKNGMWLFAI